MEAAMKKKIIFLDIDGTVMDFNGELPESARTALCRVKAEGHRLVLCTGRIKAQIYRELLEMNFDGIIASAGAYIECGGREIYRHVAAPGQLARLVDYFEETGTTYMLQTKQGVVMTEKSRKAMVQHFTDMGMTEDGGGYFSEGGFARLSRCGKNGLLRCACIDGKDSGSSRRLF